MKELPRKLGLLDAVSVVVGTLIGAGIFLVPNLVARRLPDPASMIGAWVFAGVLSFFGALACAELGAMLPASGGHYVYLREAYGPLMAFLCGWAYFLVVISAAIAWLGISFATYLGQFISLPPLAAKAVAVALIGFLTLINYRGARPGATVQKAFTFLKLLGLAVLIGACLLAQPHAAPDPPAFSGFGISRFGAALIGCLLAYDGWIAAAFVAGEIRRPQRNIPLAIGIGLVICTAIYVGVNFAYLRVLPVAGIAAADRVGAAAAARSMGSGGAAFVSVLILVSIVGSANGWILATPRLFFAQARDGLFFRRFAAVHARFETPSFAILLFGVWSAVLALTGTYETLASFAMLATWIFYGFTAIAVVILRRKFPSRERPYRMWGYPLTPVLFALAALGFVTNTLITVPGPSVAGLAIIAAGIPAYHVWRYFHGRTARLAQRVSDSR